MKACKYSKVSKPEKILNHICKLAYSNLTINPYVASLYHFLSSYMTATFTCGDITQRHWLLKGTRKLFLTLHLASKALLSQKCFDHWVS